MYPYRLHVDMNRLVTYSIGLYAINLIEGFVPENYTQISAIVCNIRRLIPEQANLNVFGCHSEAGLRKLVPSFRMGLAWEAGAKIRLSGRCDVMMDLLSSFPDGFGS